MHANLFWVDGSWPGRLAIAPRPRGADWLDDELKAFRRAGIHVVVCLLTDDEMADLDLRKEPDLCRANAMQWISLPIEDRGVPTDMDETRIILAKAADALREGRNVLVHCRQGIGRAGMAAVGILSLLGVDPTAAIDLGSAARGQAIPETIQQREWALNFGSPAGVR